MLPFTNFSHFSMHEHRRKPFPPTQKISNGKLQTLLEHSQPSLLPISAVNCQVNELKIHNLLSFDKRNLVNMPDCKGMNDFKTNYPMNMAALGPTAALNDKSFILRNQTQANCLQKINQYQILKNDAKEFNNSDFVPSCLSMNCNQAKPTNNFIQLNHFPDLYPPFLPRLPSPLQASSLNDFTTLSSTRQVPISSPLSGSFLPPSWWRLSSMMLASQLLNSHFIQTANECQQKTVTSPFHEAKFSIKKRQHSSRNTLDAKRICSEINFSQDQGNRIEEKPSTTERNYNIVSCSKKHGKASNLFTEKRPNGKNKHKLMLGLKDDDSSNPCNKQSTNEKTRLSTSSTNTKASMNTQSHVNQEKIESKLMQSLHHYFSTPGCTFLETPLSMSLPNQNSGFQDYFTPKQTASPNRVRKSNCLPVRSTVTENGIKSKDKKAHRCCYCGKLYSRKYGLKIHIRTHTGYKPLKCKICGRPFGDPSNLNKHVRLHAEGATPYRCRFCGKVLVRRRDLERHINSRHPEKKETESIGTPIVCSPTNSAIWPAK